MNSLRTKYVIMHTYFINHNIMIKLFNIVRIQG
ncbi:hypothetical protein EMIT019CA3_160085 [Bacillus pseudomycoides]